MANNAMYRVPDSILNALSGPQGPMGMSPNVNRLSLLPRYSAQEGLVAPQWLYDMARAVEAPGNALMGHQTTPEEAFNFAGNIAGAGLGTSAAMRAPAPGPGKTIAQTVYHGSPHNFDAFDMSKIGTGEGAQAYGHGLYVAENPNVAKSYVTAGPAPAADAALFDGKPMIGRPVDDFGEHANALNWYTSYGDMRTTRAALQGRKDHVIKELESLIASGRLKEPSGNLYTVDLPDSAIANMLDWDAPLSQQPKSVQEALAAVDPDFYKPGSPDYDPTETGQMIYQRILHDRRNNAIARGANKDTTLPASQAQASEWLRSLGIPGIRYFDGASRTAKDGTRNFVVFDDKLLKILNKE